MKGTRLQERGPNPMNCFGDAVFEPVAVEDLAHVGARSLELPCVSMDISRLAMNQAHAARTKIRATPRHRSFRSIDWPTNWTLMVVNRRSLPTTTTGARNRRRCRPGTCRSSRYPLKRVQGRRIYWPSRAHSRGCTRRTSPTPRRCEACSTRSFPSEHCANLPRCDAGGEVTAGLAALNRCSRRPRK